jgi:hypothetical protein
LWRKAMRGCGGLRAQGTKFLAENLIMVFGCSKCYFPEPEIYVWGTLRDACRGAKRFSSKKNYFCVKFNCSVSGANYMFHNFR